MGTCLWVSDLGAWETTGTKPGGRWVWWGGGGGGRPGSGLGTAPASAAWVPRLRPASPSSRPTPGGGSKAAGQPALPGGQGRGHGRRRDSQGAAQGQGASVPGQPPPSLGWGGAEALVTLRLTFLSGHVAPTGRNSCRQGPDQLCSQGGPVLHQALLDSCLVLLSFPERSGQRALWVPAMRV